MADVLTASDGMPRQMTLPQKLRYPEAIHAGRREILQTMAQAADRIEWLERRLEIDARHPYDGIASRDETIEQLQRQVDALVQERDGWRMKWQWLAIEHEPTLMTQDEWANWKSNQKAVVPERS